MLIQRGLDKPGASLLLQYVTYLFYPFFSIRLHYLSHLELLEHATSGEANSLSPKIGQVAT